MQCVRARGREVERRSHSRARGIEEIQKSSRESFDTRATGGRAVAPVGGRPAVERAEEAGALAARPLEEQKEKREP